MSTRLFEKGRQGFADKQIDWNTDTIRAMNLNLTTADTHVKAITGATNASPIVLTITSHGWTNGDIIVVGLVGGNLAANGTWKIANQATNTVELTTLKDGLNSSGSGTYTSGGYAINLTAVTALDQINGGRVADGSGTDITLTTPTLVDGTLDADDVPNTNLTGTVHALVLYRFTSNDAGSLPAVFIDGKMLVTAAADAASSATTIWVEKLTGNIPNGTAIVFSNGITATLTAQANAGSRSLTVSALGSAIAAGHQADVASSSSGLPFTASGNNVTHVFDNGASKIIRI